MSKPIANGLRAVAGGTAVAAACTVISGMVAMPVASARQEIKLDNGLLAIVEDPKPDGQIRARTLGRPLVRGDLVTQIINVQRVGVEQKEFPIDEANSLSDTFAVEPGQTVKVQACRPRFNSYTFCTAWSTFTVAAPAAPAPPPPVVKPDPPPVVKPDPAPVVKPDPVPVARTATVTSDVDVYDAPGGGGNVIGILREGQVVPVVQPCKADTWCALADGRFAWGEFFKNN